jgi:S1-C subfamily serine protease
MRITSLRIAVAILSGASAAWAADPHDVVRRGKDATVLLRGMEAGAGKVHGTAFCIDPAGYFVTNHHVTRLDASDGRLTLVLHAGEDDELALPATVVREDRDADLAVLKVSGTAPALTALELGSSTGLIETQSLTAFGYGSSSVPTATKADPPAMSVGIGRISSLRRVKGVLQHILLDTALAAGSSGGPVLDEKGTVVGVVRSGMPQTPLNVVIPVARLATLLEVPDIEFSPPSLTHARRFDPAEFTITVGRIDKKAPPCTVELCLPGADDTPRRLVATPGPGGAFRVTVPPLLPPTDPQRLVVTLSFASGTLTGRVLDQEIGAGDRTYRLAAVSSIEGGAAPSLTLRGGETITGPVKGGDITVMLGDTAVQVDATKAKRIDVAPPPPPPTSVAYSLTVRSGDRVIGELAGALPIEDGGDNLAAANPSASIKEPTLPSERTSIKLPAPVDDILPAGGGRFLLLHMRQLRRLGVFDVNQARVVASIPLPGDDLCLAAGREKIICVSSDQGIVARYGLETFAKELVVPLEDGGSIDEVCMGSASDGPLMIMRREGFSFLDVDTLKKLQITTGKESERWKAFGNFPLRVSASADGSTFAAWQPGTVPADIHVMRLDGNRARGGFVRASVGDLIPSNDGGLLFGNGGIFSADLKQLHEEQFRGLRCVPTSHPGFFLAIAPGPDGGGNSRPQLKVTVFTTADRKPLLAISGVDDLAEPLPGTIGRPRLTSGKIVHLVPAAKLLVILSASRDSLELRRFDLLAELAKADGDYLFIASRPPRFATRHTTYTYAIDAKSRRGGTAFKLDSGPTGMTISPAGRISWRVPVDYPDGQAAVIVTVAAGSGKEILHTFTVTVR